MSIDMLIDAVLVILFILLIIVIIAAIIVMRELSKAYCGMEKW